MSKELLDYNQDGDPQGFADSPLIQHMPKRDPGMDEWGLEKELSDFLEAYGENALLAKIEQFKQTRVLV